MSFTFRILLLAFLFFHYNAQSQLTIEEHLGMENINSIQVQGSKLLYAKTEKEQWNGRTYSSIVVSDLNGENKIQLTDNEYDYDPKWSPNGAYVSFVSYRNNLQQIYIVPNSGGDARMVSDAQNYLSNYTWIDENTLAYVDDEPRDSLLVAKEKENGGGYIVGTEFFTNSLWTYDVNSGEKKKITKGDIRIIDFDISSDGKYLAILGAKNYDYYESITNSRIEVIDIENGTYIYQFNAANSLNNLQFSPSGKKIAFAGSTEGFASNDGLFIANLQTGKTENKTYEFDPTIEKLQWIDEEQIVFSTPKNAHTGIYKINLKGNMTTVVEPYWVIYDFQVVNNQVYFLASKGSKTKQLYRLLKQDAPKNAEQLSNLNADLIPKIRTSSKILDYVSKDGTSVQGILTYPPDYEASKLYPLMVIPHGGPDAVVMNDFNWMGQFFADHDYIVFQPNFRGSIGYGRSFYAGNRNAFGETDFEDIMAGVNKVVNLKIADENKIVIGGWSYGGYMANWAVTQTNTFKAAISIAGVSNWVSMYGQHEFSNRDIGIWEYKSLLIDNPENYRKCSPIFFVKNAETPLLILHGANDPRSPVLQAWEMYRAMKDAKKEVEMIIYPRGGHNISNPIQFKSVLTNWLEWANKHIENK